MCFIGNATESALHAHIDAINGLLHITATRGDLIADLTTHRLHGIDDLLARHPQRALDVAQRRLNLLRRAVERRCQLSDRRAVSLNCVHEKFTSGVTVELRRQTVRAVASESEAVTAPAEEEQDDPDPPAPVAAPRTAVVVTVHECRYEVGVHALVAHHGRDESCDVKAATRAASIENISFIRTHFKRLLNDCRPR